MPETDAQGKRLTFEDISRLHERQEEITRANSQYLKEHPELKSLIADFTAAILIQKPNDVFNFAKSHFSVFLRGGAGSIKESEQEMVYTGTHVISDRRYELVIEQSSDRSQWLKVEAKDLSSDHKSFSGTFSASEILSRFQLSKPDVEKAAIQLSRVLKQYDGKLVLSDEICSSPSIQEYDASVKIQAIGRARQERQKMEHCKTENQAATKIQSQHRRNATQKRVTELKNNNVAASKIQAVYRGNATREEMSLPSS